MLALVYSESMNSQSEVNEKQAKKYFQSDRVIKTTRVAAAICSFFPSTINTNIELHSRSAPHFLMLH